jgi:hypothetical protein
LLSLKITDSSGVFASSLRREFSFSSSPVSFRIDYNNNAKILLREARDVCSLLQKCHLSMTEVLFSTHYCWTSDDWTALQSRKEELISQNLVKMVCKHCWFAD